MHQGLSSLTLFSCIHILSVCTCGQTLACVVEQLETAGFFSESIAKNRLFVTVHDAVLSILKRLGQTDFVLVSSSPCTLHYPPRLLSVNDIIYILHCLSPTSPLFSRMFPATPGCNQQGSHCSNSPSTSSSWWRSFAHYWPSVSPPPLVGENALPWHGGRLPWKYREALPWQHAFYDIVLMGWPAIRHCRSLARWCVWERGRRGGGWVGECNTGLIGVSIFSLYERVESQWKVTVRGDSNVREKRRATMCVCVHVCLSIYILTPCCGFKEGNVFHK